MIKYGANVDYKNRFGLNILHVAAQYGTNETMKYLIDNFPQVDINAQSKNGETVLKKYE